MSYASSKICYRMLINTSVASGQACIIERFHSIQMGNTKKKSNHTFVPVIQECFMSLF